MKRTGIAMWILCIFLGLSSLIVNTPDGYVVLGSLSFIMWVSGLVFLIKHWNRLQGTPLTSMQGMR